MQPRGIREKILQKTLQKYVDFCDKACKKGISDCKCDTNQEPLDWKWDYWYELAKVSGDAFTAGQSDLFLEQVKTSLLMKATAVADDN